MRRIVVASALGCCLATAAVAPALAGPSHPAHPAKAKVFASKVTPNPAKVGGTVTLKSSKAVKNTTYYCVEIAIKGAAYAYDLTTAPPSSVKSTSKGDLTCKKTVVKFTNQPVVSGGSGTASCPPSKKQAKQGWSCALSLADMATSGQKSASVAKFKVK